MTEPTVRAQKNGPLAVQGQIEIEDITWPEGAVRDRFTLCRCGASRTMPFCDGSHITVGFTDE
jgi:CDGSH-type Zn-finger protein